MTDSDETAFERDSRGILSPNPAKSGTNIYLPTKIGSATLKFFATTGQAILTKHITAGWNLVELVDIAPGLYSGDNGKILQTGKLVKVE